jgi:hypothetical protein
MSFTILNLAGNRALVKGQDAHGTTGQQILDASEWADVKARNAHSEAHDAFDAAVEEFFAPLSAAVDALKETAKPKHDPLFYITVSEGSAPVEGSEEILIHLNHDSAVLRLIEQDPETDRLIWVNDSLEILEASKTVTPTVSFDLESTDTKLYSGEAEGTDSFQA